METCQGLPPGAGFVSSLTNFVDCQAQTLGSGAYQALALPGSTLSILLTGFLTIFIALVGYNLLLGRTLSIREGTLAFVKIGAVLALTTSWPAYRTLVYDLIVDGPGQIVSEIGRPAGVVGSDGTLLQRLDLSDNALSQIAVLGPGNPVRAPNSELAPPPFAGFDAFALGGSRILFLLTALASLGSLRIISGLLLALGPFFIAFFMFDATRSLFEGWGRVLAGAALATVGVSIALGLELALLEPWLSQVLARRMAGEALPSMPTELFVIVTLFSIVAFATLLASARIARAFRLPAIVRQAVVSDRASPTFTANVKADGPERLEIERSRAAAVASFISTVSRRDRFATAGDAPEFAGSARLIAPSARSEDARPSTPVGRSFRRQARARVSASMNKRDATS
jgi:type IV secretion system protein VirB6